MSDNNENLKLNLVLARDKQTKAFIRWIMNGRPEADEDMNSANIEYIKAYRALHKNTKLFAYNKGFVDIPDDQLTNFCTDFMFASDDELLIAGLNSNYDDPKAVESLIAKSDIDVAVLLWS